MEKELNEIYQEGRDVGLSGDSRSRNPYSSYIDTAKWYSGWCAGISEFRRQLTAGKQKEGDDALWQHLRDAVSFENPDDTENFLEVMNELRAVIETLYERKK